MVLVQEPGLSEGISVFSDAIARGIEQQAKRSQLEKILGASPPQGLPSFDEVKDSEPFRQQFLNIIQNYENQTGKMMNPDQLDMAWNDYVQSSQNQFQQRQNTEGKLTQAQLYEISKLDPVLGNILLKDQMQKEKLQQQRELLEGKQDKPTTEYVTAVQSAGKSANQTLRLIDKVKKNMEKATFGPISGRVKGPFDPESQAIQSQLATLFGVYEALYKGGRISDQKFQYIKSQLPKITDTKEVFKRKLEAFEEMAKEDQKKARRLSEIRKKEGRIPNNIFDLLEAPEEEIHEEVAIETPQEQIVASQTIPVGKRFQNKKTGEIIEWTGNKWRKIK